MGTLIAFALSMMPEEKTSKKGPARSGRVFAFALPLVLLAGVGFWFFTSRNTDASAQGNEISPVRSTFHLETFVLNVGGSESRAYLRIGIDLALNQETKRAEETVPVAPVRDTILGVLSETKSDDLLTAGGKTKLKQDLLHALQERVPQLGVQEVYFTEFLIQR